MNTPLPPMLILLSVLCVLWAQSKFIAHRLLNQWRKTPHYAPLWIMISLPAYMSALWPVMEALR